MTTLRTYCVVLLFILPAYTTREYYEPLKALISNGLVTAEILLPDAKNGYYRGSRFDWSGVISSLEYQGHSYFGKWFDKYDPTLHDAIMGPVDEFREPLGYEEAPAGGEFVKVGVGALKKPDGANYSFSKKYEITDPGKWTVRAAKDNVTFSHELTAANGYSYRYKKVVRLVPGKAALVIEHQLTNTGSRPIKTNTYNHNFFMIDNEPTGPHLVTSFDFDVEAQGRGFGDLATAHERTVRYTRQLQRGENVFSPDLKARKAVPAPYAFRVVNTKTGAAVSVHGNRPVDTMIYWACATTACPEPYINLLLEPGESTDWEITYEFHTKRQP